MTPDELDRKMKALMTRRHGLETEIVKAARAAIPVLKDAGRMHSAKELDELFFQFDAVEQEMTSEIMNAGGKTAGEYLIRQLERSARG